ncbi:MAG: hypothetical protein KKA35_03120, partial [Proteobacteria bacterium]|nr:hypothetical protein [Pseudomonadota bacterium]
NFNRRNTWSISRMKIFAQRRDRPKWDVLKLALGNKYNENMYLLSSFISFCNQQQQPGLPGR